jgi:hypothetical protein
LHSFGQLMEGRNFLCFLMQSPLALFFFFYILSLDHATSPKFFFLEPLWACSIRWDSPQKANHGRLDLRLPFVHTGRAAHNGPRNKNYDGRWYGQKVGPEVKEETNYTLLINGKDQNLFEMQHRQHEATKSAYFVLTH